MKVIAIILAGATAALAAPAAAAEGCKPNAFESLNLGHHHDINTGKILIGGRIIETSAKGGGSGCSPLWAGGDYDDRSTFPDGKYPPAIEAQLGSQGVATLSAPSTSVSFDSSILSKLFGNL